jgi:hypothetical protein
VIFQLKKKIRLFFVGGDGGDGLLNRKKLGWACAVGSFSFSTINKNPKK